MNHFFNANQKDKWIINMKYEMGVIKPPIITIAMLVLTVIVGAIFSHNVSARLNATTDTKTVIIPQVSYPGSWGNYDPWIKPVHVIFNTDNHTYEVSMVPVLSAVNLSCHYSLNGEQTHENYAGGDKSGIGLHQINFSFEDNSVQNKRYKLHLFCINDDSPIFSANATAFISNVNIYNKGH